MKFKKRYALVAVCVTLLGCLGTTVYADCPTLDSDSMQTAEYSVSSRATGSFEMTVLPDRVIVIGASISLERDEIVSFNCVYSPKSADIDIGLIDSDGDFYYVSGANGNIDQTVRIGTRGTYTPAIRNNSSYTISISGFLDY